MHKQNLWDRFQQYLDEDIALRHLLELHGFALSFAKSLNEAYQIYRKPDHEEKVI